MLETPKQDRPAGKHKKKGKHDTLDLSQINNDVSLSQKSSPRGSRVTSTPNIGRLKQADVKSIMRNTSTFINDTMDSVNLEDSFSKRKKRNKSVSFMLEDNEQVAMKKSKSDTSAISKPKYKSPKKGQEIQSAHKDETKQKKGKRIKDAEKENQEASESRKANIAEEYNIDMAPKRRKPKLEKKNSILGTEQAYPDGDNVEPAEKKKEKKKRYKKKKNVVNSESSEQNENDSNSNQDNAADAKEKKNKRKKRQMKPAENAEMNGEPKKKSSKKDIVPEVVAEDLEKLNIGDNPHTLTNLLDEMKVVDKNKKKKKSKKNKDKLKGNNKNPTPDTEATEKGDIVNDLKKIEEGKEKVIWKKRKWNKDRKAGGSTDEMLATSVIVDNLPLKIMLEYRKMLSDHFSKFGPVKSIGVAEVYPSEEPKPVFTTTVAFDSEGAATEALSEDNTAVFGSRIRVRRPLPAAATTVVLRSYGDMTEQALSSAFVGAGRIRSFRHLVKGKKTIATAFVEFDGPEAVERALKMAEDVKIGGKKIHASKFVPRPKREEANGGPGSD